MNTLSYALTDAPTSTCDVQLIAITVLCDLFQNWADSAQASPATLQSIHQKPHSCTTKLKKRRHYCQPLTPQPKTHPPTPPPRVHSLEAAVQLPRVCIPVAIAPTPRMEKYSPRLNTIYS